MQQWVTSILSRWGNHYLDLDANSQGRLRELEGKTLCIQFSDWQLECYASVEDGRLKVLLGEDQPYDARLSGSAGALLGLGLSTHKEDPVLRGEVKLSGQMAVGQKFQALLQDLDIDWEEHLSAIVGDHLAHPILVQAKGLRDWILGTGENLRQDMSEFLREESLQLPYEDEVEEFRHEVSRLRDDVERLAIRVQRLSKAGP